MEEEEEREERKGILNLVRKVEEIKGKEEVNKYLRGLGSKRWWLLKVLGGRERSPDITVEESQEVAIYVIGWPYSGKPEYPK